ncbi:sodium leak channel non-selective protein-like, partial [Diaphorina citri]|uniref:Sodium leak channel non-selective protein-like n=1 Tax=Diaphorina citri TaxID=121845 RepID=A0A3Q0IZK1_DIACI
MNSEETVKPAGIPGTAQHQEPKTSTNQEILRPIEQPNSSLDSGSQQLPYCFSVTYCTFATDIARQCLLNAESEISYTYYTLPLRRLEADAEQVLVSDGTVGWKLVTLDENKQEGLAPMVCQRFLKSAYFRLLIMVAILANAIIMATMNFQHDGRPRNVFYEKYYPIEVCFTLFLDLEALFKIWCLGFNGYIQHSYHKFELMLCAMTTLHIIPQLYLSPLTYFQ